MNHGFRTTLGATLCSTRWATVPANAGNYARIRSRFQTRMLGGKSSEICGIPDVPKESDRMEGPIADLEPY